MEDFDELEFSDLPKAICPNCSTEVPDHDNGGDPANWWNSDNIPECHLKHTCHDCGQQFRINVTWSPTFAVIPIEHDEEYAHDHTPLDEA